MSKGLTYTDSGVNKEEGYRAVELMKAHVKRTHNKNVLCDLGSFGGLFQLDTAKIKNPVLVSGTDGVGTKLKLAFLMDKHDTVGIDLVAMCVNDVLCQGARPLFFLDYLATGHLKAEKAADIVKGISDGCVDSGCALIGGETAEMPGFYGEGEYDMAGFTVGVVDKDSIIDGSNIKDGDVILGLPSSGIHSNGYSLVRKLFIEKLGWDLDRHVDQLGDTIGNTLLTPTRIYVKALTGLFGKHNINGLCHITGGGFIENIPRVLPEGLGVEINTKAWDAPKIFDLIEELGEIDKTEMFNTFNMGIGFAIIASKEESVGIKETLSAMNEPVYEIGYVKKGIEGVRLCP